ncbi:MAG: hypothetical protein Q8877_02835, partial [Sweet potato little leaf phytoplasma]|nr:hypothetical protein [Sweet potato little leaf phytoplasma]
CIISDYNNNLLTRYRPIGFSLARMNLLLKNQELLCVDVENPSLVCMTLFKVGCASGVVLGIK